MVPGQGRRAVADPAALAPPRHRPARRRRRVRRGAVPPAAPRWCRCCSAASVTTPGTPTGWSGPCSRPSTSASVSRGAPRCRCTSATAATARPASCGATAATRWPSGSRASSRRTPASGPPLVTDWREGRDTDGAGSPLDSDLLWQAELWRRLLTADPRGPARRAAPAHARAARRPAATGSTCRPGCRCSGTPGCRSPRSSCSARSAEHRDVHLYLPQPSPVAVGRAGRPRRRGGPRRRPLRRPGRAPAARLARPRRPRAAPHAAHRRLPGAATPPESHRTSRPPCSAGCSTTCAPTTPRRSRSARSRQLTRGRPQPAGARLPRRRTPGRRAARGAGRAARGRPDARAARHPRDVPRHRDVRAADLGRLRARARRGAARPSATPRTGSGSGSPTARSPAPTRCCAWPACCSSCSGGRVTASDVLDLARGEPCRRRFGFTDDDLDRMGRWVAGTGVRWGLDAASRAARSRWSASPTTPGAPGSTGCCSGSR